MSFSGWLNGTMMTSFRSFCLTVAALVAIVTSLALSSALLLDRSSTRTLVSKDPAVRAEGRTAETTRQNHGKDLITVVFTFLTAAIITNAASQYGDRTTSREHVKAKAEGQVLGVAGAAAAAKLVEDAKNGKSSVKDMTVTAENVEVTEKGGE